MTVTNLAIGQQVNLATIFNTKLEKPILQSEMGLDVLASATKQAVRWDEFSVKHNNDGTFKAGIITTDDIGDGAVTSPKAPSLLYYADIISDLVISGNLPATSTTLSTTIPEQIAYITGLRVNKLAETYTFTASTDTYVDLGSNGVYTYISVSNGSTAPAVTANSMRMFKIITDATTITTVTDLRTTTLTITKLSGIVGNQLSATAGILGSQLANHKNYKKSSLVTPSATADTWGTAVSLLPPTGFVSLSPLAIDVVFGGTFGTETVTADVTVFFSDGTTVAVDKTATAVGTVSFSNSDLMTLSKDGVYITKINVNTKSSIANSTANATFNHYGLYL